MKMYLALLIVIVLAIHLNNTPGNVGIAMDSLAQSGVSLFETIGDLIEH